jgi:hypothetical protein
MLSLEEIDTKAENVGNETIKSTSDYFFLDLAAMEENQVR